MGGVPPKPADQRARRNKDPIVGRTIAITPDRQPPLPPKMPDGEQWPLQTRRWWKMWRNSPLSSEFIDADWTFLLDTAVIHGKLWNGDTSVAAELRLRVAKFGMTAEDRARLRITFAAADKAESDGGTSSHGSARERRSGLKAVD